MAERNDALAYQTLDYIREHPEEWNQGDYFCGTTACFAGRAIILEAQNRGLENKRDLYLEGYRHTMRVAMGLLDWNEHTMRVAMGLLGWNEDEASYVFHHMTGNFDVLERRVKAVLNGEVA